MWQLAVESPAAEAEEEVPPEIVGRPAPWYDARKSDANDVRFASSGVEHAGRSSVGDDVAGATVGDDVVGGRGVGTSVGDDVAVGSVGAPQDGTSQKAHRTSGSVV